MGRGVQFVMILGPTVMPELPAGMDISHNFIATRGKAVACNTITHALSFALLLVLRNHEIVIFPKYCCSTMAISICYYDNI